MKPFLLLIHLGHVGGVAGPLPYDMAECGRRAAEMQATNVAAWADPEKAAKLRAADPRMGPDGIRFLCRELRDRPKLGEPWVDLPRASR